MTNNTRTLVKHEIKIRPHLSEVEALMRIIDHYNYLQLYDRDRASERIKQLEERIAKLEGQNK